LRRAKPGSGSNHHEKTDRLGTHTTQKRANVGLEHVNGAQAAIPVSSKRLPPKAATGRKLPNSNRLITRCQKTGEKVLQTSIYQAY
jgi:hypothetical protein